MANRRFGAFSSSADPNKLAATWKGALLGLIPVVIAVSAHFGVDVAEADLTQLIEGLTAIVALGWTTFGVARKLYLAFTR